MTFSTGMIEIGNCSDEELKTMLDEAREASKHSRRLGKVMGIVAVHRLKNIREFLAYQELATWRRMNGFDRVVEGKESCFHGHRSLPPTPQEYYAGLWSEVNALKASILMPAEDTMTRPSQMAIDFVDGLKGKLPDEELAVIKRYVEKRSREAAQAQVTVTPVGTVQYSSPCPLDPEPSSSTYVSLENTEGEMGPELEELESLSAGMGLKTPRQQRPPNEGIWKQGQTTANGFLTVGVGSSQGGRISSTTECEDTKTFADTSSTAATPENRRRKKPRSEQNTQFDPGGKGEKAPPWNAAVSLLSFFCLSWEAPCSCFVRSALCVLCFPKFLFSIQVTTSQRS